MHVVDGGSPDQLLVSRQKWHIHTQLDTILRDQSIDRKQETMTTTAPSNAHGLSFLRNGGRDNIAREEA